MFGSATRLGFSQVFQTVSCKLSTYGVKTVNIMGRKTTTGYGCREKLSPGNLLHFTETSRSASATFSSAVPSMSANDDVTELMSVFPEIVRDLTQNAETADIPEVMTLLGNMLEHSVLCEKTNLSKMLLAAYKAFADADQLTTENLRKAHILGWCCELGLASALILDDVIDDSRIRGGKPCWHLLKSIPKSAINDAAIVEHGAFEVLRLHFREDALYLPLVDLYQKMLEKIAGGQCLDGQSMLDGKPQLDLFTRARYDDIIKHKTASTVFTPIEFALLLAGVVDADIKAKAESVMVEIGKWYQVQDDFLDYAATSEEIGKEVANDIKNGRCSWLAVTALERVSPAQRLVMKRCYGSADPDHIQAIRDLYAQLNMPKLFSGYEEECLNRIRTQIQRDFSGKPREMFIQAIEKLHRRNR